MQKVGESSASSFGADFPSGLADKVEIAGFVICRKVLEHPDTFLGSEKSRFRDVIGKVRQRNGRDADQMQDGTQHLSLPFGSRLQTSTKTLGRRPADHRLEGRN